MCGIARPGLALILSASFFLPQPAHSAGSVRHAPAHTTAPLSPYEKAQKLHEALIGRPQDERTRRDYERVLDAYRAVYHADPASPKADASVSAVADILAEEGRTLDDEKTLRDAIGQYEFLRREYPASRLCPNALLTEAAIYQQDLGERADAKAKYQEFLKAYPHSALADQARQGLKTIHNAEVAEKRGTRLQKSKVIVVEDGPLAETKTAKAPEPQPSSNKAASSFPSAVNPPVKVAVSENSDKGYAAGDSHVAECQHRNDRIGTSKIARWEAAAGHQHSSLVDECLYPGGNRSGYRGAVRSGASAQSGPHLF